VPRVIRSPADPQGQWFLEDLVVPGRLVVRMQEDMGMRINQAGQNRGPWQFQHASLRRHLHFVRRSYALDLLATDHDHPAGVRLQGPAIEYLRRFEHDRPSDLRPDEARRHHHDDESHKAWMLHRPLRYSWQGISLPLSSYGDRPAIDMDGSVRSQKSSR